MMKTIAALAALAACACASAQSAVSVFGTVDMYVGHAKSGAYSSTRQDSGGNSASRLGFRGTEDLGGGWSARFVLEGGLDTDTGTGNGGSAFSFMRQSSLGLSGPWGALDMGRMYTPMFQAVARADAFALNTVFSPMNLAAMVDAQPGLRSFAPRASNMLRYRTPLGQGLFTDLAYAPGEAGALSQRSGDLYSGSLGWSRQPWYVAYAFQRAYSGSAAVPVADPEKSTYQSLSAAYRGPQWQFFGTLARNEVNRPGVGAAQLVSLGAAWNATLQSRLAVAVVQRKVSHSARSQRAWTLGYDYALSKRTALYSRWLHLDNGANASASLAQIPVAANSGNSASLIAVGVRHNF
ncbi:porin [Acidovorax sp. Be4]|uniref:Porin n=1 Tax=Acidovorax bellezanensis TaxID=2976702 RepID=A0ABT2PMP8_9BURK|nr:porin [Acidovorax sp. Be4]MCT9811750.1 porin [Acidovorax sp. Be4]